MIVHFRLLRSDGSEEDGTAKEGWKGEGVVYYFVHSLGCDNELREWLTGEQMPLNKNPNFAMSR